MVPRNSVFCAALVLAAPATPALAQQAPDVFGTADEGITVVGFQDFFPSTNGSPGYTDVSVGERTSTGGDNALPGAEHVAQRHVDHAARVLRAR